MHNPKSILVEILREAQSKGISTTTTQLVKLLYLAEVEYFRETSLRLTNLDWLFYQYGPYALELGETFEDKIFEKTEIESQTSRTYVEFKVAEPVSTFGTKLDPKVGLVIKRVVGTWGKLPLEELLDYVYFETEPMQNVERRGERLDFATIKKENSSIVIPLKASTETDKKILLLRQRLAPTLKQLAEQKLPDEPVDEAYREAMDAWDEEEAIDLEALRRLKITIKSPSASDTQGH